MISKRLYATAVALRTTVRQAVHHCSNNDFRPQFWYWGNHTTIARRTQKYVPQSNHSKKRDRPREAELTLCAHQPLSQCTRTQCLLWYVLYFPVGHPNFCYSFFFTRRRSCSKDVPTVHVGALCCDWPKAVGFPAALLLGSKERKARRLSWR